MKHIEKYKTHINPHINYPHAQAVSSFFKKKAFLKLRTILSQEGTTF